MKKNLSIGEASRRRRVLLSMALLLYGTATTVLADPPAAEPPLTIDQRVAHLLNRMGYGARPGDRERVERMGIDRYIDEQLHPERIDDGALDARLAGFDVVGSSIAGLYERYPQRARLARMLGLGAAPKKGDPGSDTAAGDGGRGEALRAYYKANDLKQPAAILQELQGQRIVRAVASERQLQEVMTNFWLNHFNIFWGKGQDKWLTADFEMNAVRPNTLGSFRDLLMATAKSPAMLFYLDNFLSSVPDPRGAARRGADSASPPKKRPAGINENYAREIMELHTLGVEGGYTQHDVQEVARCFTGWTLDRSGAAARFVFRPRMHDRGEKTVLGVKIPAGGGIEDGEKVIEILATDPGTARFIATKLVRRFVSDDPPSALVDRVAGVYARTGGDIREMLRTILTSPEFQSPAAYRAKIKSPFELVVSSVRALGGVTDGSPRIARSIARMGEPLYMYQPPTGYPDRAGQWVSSGALVERLNFALALAAGRLPGTAVDPNILAAGLDAVTGEALVDGAFGLVLGGDVSPATRAIVLRQMVGERGGTGGAKGGVERSNGAVARALGLVLGSPEFQRR